MKPEFITYTGDDPDGYALSVNIARRHLTKGQQAMVIAKADEYKNYTDDLTRESGVSKQYVSWARQVLKHARDLVDAVIAGSTPLDKAYAEARRIKAERETREEKAAAAWRASRSSARW